MMLSLIVLIFRPLTSNICNSTWVDTGKVNAIDDEALHQFKEFIYNWLTEHILVQDMKYFRYSQERG